MEELPFLGYTAAAVRFGNTLIRRAKNQDNARGAQLSQFGERKGQGFVSGLEKRAGKRDYE